MSKEIIDTTMVKALNRNMEVLQLKRKAASLQLLKELEKYCNVSEDALFHINNSNPAEFQIIDGDEFYSYSISEAIDRIESTGKIN